MVNGSRGCDVQQTVRTCPARGAEGETDSELLSRFITQQDAVAFETLVRRHGPLVLGVCRRVLKDSHSAEDAFQATFLVLVRKAHTMARPELLGNWLYGVACRIARKMKSSAARRCASEQQAALRPRRVSPAEGTGADLAAAIDEALLRLPEKYRVPLILCYLEGRTNKEAARLLGLPPGSMSWRLARGRELLRERLDRRGFAFSAVLFPGVLTQHVAAPSVPPELLASTVKQAVAWAAGSAAGVIPESVAALAESVLRAGWWGARRKLTAALLTALLVAGVAAAGVTYSLIPGERKLPEHPAQYLNGEGCGDVDQAPLPN